jgi:hypothetical protein
MLLCIGRDTVTAAGRVCLNRPGAGIAQLFIVGSNAGYRTA